MRLRLFWKIWLGFWATFLLLSYGLWLYWSVQPDPTAIDWDAPRAAGTVLIASAANALEEGGVAGLKRQIAAWPQIEQKRLSLRSGPGPCSPTGKRELAIPVSSGGTGYCLRYATPALPKDDSEAIMPPDFLVATALAGLAFSAGLAWYLTKPIYQLRKGFDRLADGDFGVRLGPAMGRRRDEIADLAGDFDRMAEGLAELVAARDRLLHDVSHELRSPLARMRLASGLLRRDPARFETSLDRIDHEADHLDQIVGELLTLARFESGAERSEEYFEVVEILNIVLSDVKFEATSQNVRIETDFRIEASEDDWLVAGSGLLARRAVENVLRNAVRFSPRGEAIQMRLTRSGGNCTIFIEDVGPGIRAAEPRGLLKPFVQDRSPESAGYGLGLAIAQRAVAACAGTLDLANRNPTGLSVSITFPLALAHGRSE